MAEIERLRNKIEQLEQDIMKLSADMEQVRDGALQARRNAHLTFDALVEGDLHDTCRNLVLLPADGLKCFVESMEIVELHKTWEKEMDRCSSASALGFRNAVVLCLLRCRWAISEIIVAWIMGIGASNRRHVGRIFKSTLLLMNVHLSHTVAQPPDISQVDKDALPAFRHPDLDNVMMTADATNIGIQTPHNPYNQNATYSDYNGDNCVKCEVISSNAGLPMFVTPAFGGRATEAEMLEQSDFASFYKPVEKNCIDETGKPFKPAVWADKGTRIKKMVTELGGQYIVPSMIIAGETTHRDILKNEIISKARGHVERCIGCAKRNG